MEHLQTISEVSITLSGLAGIVSVLAGGSQQSPERLWRVRNLILLSLLAFVLGLLPQGAAAFGTESGLIWQVSSALLVAALLFQFWFSLTSVDDSWKHDYWRTNRHLLLFYTVGSLAVITLQFWNIFADTPGAGPFFAGLTWLLIVACVHLFVLVIRQSPDRV